MHRQSSRVPQSDATVTYAREREGQIDETPHHHLGIEFPAGPEHRSAVTAPSEPETSHQHRWAGRNEARSEKRSEAATRTLVEQLRKGYRAGVLEIDEKRVADRVIEALLLNEERWMMAQDRPCFRRISRMIF